MIFEIAGLAYESVAPVEFPRVERSEKHYYTVVASWPDGRRPPIADGRMTAVEASQMFEDLVATAPRPRRRSAEYGIFMYRNDEATPVAGERFYASVGD